MVQETIRSRRTSSQTIPSSVVKGLPFNGIVAEACFVAIASYEDESLILTRFAHSRLHHGMHQMDGLTCYTATADGVHVNVSLVNHLE